MKHWISSYLKQRNLLSSKAEKLVIGTKGLSTEAEISYNITSDTVHKSLFQIGLRSDLKPLKWFRRYRAFLIFGRRTTAIIGWATRAMEDKLLFKKKSSSKAQNNEDQTKQQPNFSEAYRGTQLNKEIKMQNPRNRNRQRKSKQLKKAYKHNQQARYRNHRVSESTYQTWHSLYTS